MLLVSMLLKLTLSVNLTNILWATFKYKKVFCSVFMCLKFGFVCFWKKEISTKADHKMLVKLAAEEETGEGPVAMLKVKEKQK